jgi:DNA-binding NtrC family response regulator
VLLDEIGDISPRLQVALLRVLETGEVRPVGASRSRKIACRILAATNVDLSRATKEGRFRNDLHFRLQRLEINIPPLRERRDDILFLADHFLSEGRPKGQRAVMSGGLRDALLQRDWPGNVRELRNTVERMRLLNSDKLAYDLDDLDPAPARGPGDGRAVETSRPGVREGNEPVYAPPVEGAAGRGDARVARYTWRSMHRRREALLDLFRHYIRLNRAEIVPLLGISPSTATADLRALCAEGAIEKVMPTPSPRTHYFQLRG